MVLVITLLPMSGIWLLSLDSKAMTMTQTEDGSPAQGAVAAALLQRWCFSENGLTFLTMAL